MEIPSELLSTIQTRLLDWYAQHRRDLPWRETSDPYRVWVSEVMLQQTQVTTVIPYYRRFLARFPSLADLAAASLDEVLKLWAGLGYYARARNLHRAAKEIAAAHGGRLPETYAALRRLPGFGDYTAGAVGSIAFGEAVPAVDGNARRVLARLFAVQADTRTRQIKTLAAALAGSAERPGDWTQALIELGATVCRPSSPKCLLCPVRDLCRGWQLGMQARLPLKPGKKALPHYDVTAAVIYRNGDRDAFLIAQRPLEGMLGGLWEFPGGKQEPGETLKDCLRREIREELGVEIAVGEQFATVKHGYTHFKITLHAFHCQLVRGQPQALEVNDWRWVTPEELDNYAFPSTDRKIIEALQAQVNRPSPNHAR
ncbi:MAG: A/G-specific adenine glycosylase [Anaerolineae bacterium]